MTTRHDWTAPGPRGDYVLQDAGLSGLADASDIAGRAREIRRHRDALERCFLARSRDGIGLPLDVRSPAQVEMFGEGRS